MAVYTRFTNCQLEAFLTNYNIGNVIELKEIIQGIENSNYFLTTTTGKYILTIYEKRVSIHDLPFYLSFAEYLNQHHIPTPQAVHTKNNELFTDFMEGKKAAIIQFLDGNNLDIPNEQQCQSVGAFIANMHLVQSGFEIVRENNLSPSGSLWSLYEKIKKPMIDELPNFVDFIDKQVNYIQKKLS